MTSPGPERDGEAGRDAFFFDVAVVGLGPSGISAATELVRYGRHVVALEAERVGGLVHEARRVENLPILLAPSPGGDVVEALKGHLTRLGPRLLDARVKTVRQREDGFDILTEEVTLRSRAVVLATGTKPCRLGVPGEDLPWVAHRWTDLRGRPPARVAVVGGGDLAVDQAMSLADARFEVELLVRSKGLRCNRRLAGELEGRTSVHLHSGHEVVRFSDGPIVECKGPDGPVRLQVDCALVSIGRDPELPPILDLRGAAIDPKDVLSGGVPGLFPVGDLVAGKRRQVAIAMGSGLDAAMRCEEFLQGADR